jgi:hypothetical protein
MGGPWDDYGQGPDGPWNDFKGLPQVAFPEESKLNASDVQGLSNAHVRGPLDIAADEKVAKERAGGGMAQAFDDKIRELASGVAGDYANRFAAMGNAGLNAISGGKLGEPWEEGLAHQHATDRAIDAESSKLGTLPLVGDVTTGGLTKLAGGLASGFALPLGVAAKGASALANTARVGGLGALYGGLYGSGEGDTLGQRVGNAAIGSGLGLVGGALSHPLASGLGNAAGYIASKFRGVPAELAQFGRGGINKVSELAGNDKIFAPGPQYYERQAGDLGREGMLADMGPNLRDATGALANQPGEGQSTVANALEGRDAGAQARIEQQMNSSLGAAQNVPQMIDDLKAKARQAAGPLYDRFNATPIKPTEELQSIVGAIPKKAFNAANELMQVERFDPSSPGNTGKMLDYVKRGLDAVAEQNTDDFGHMNSIGRGYSNLSRQLRDELDRIVGGAPGKGAYAEARQAAGDGIRAKQAALAGQQAFSKKLTPDQMRRDMARFSRPEERFYQAGARDQLHTIMGNAATAFGPNGDVAARRTLASEFGQDKLQQIVGTKPANALVNRLNTETKFDETLQNALRNSKTASRHAAQKMFPGPDDKAAFSRELGTKTIPGMALEGSYRIANALLGGHLDVRRLQVAADAAKMLVAQGAKRDEIAKGLFDYARSKRLSGQARQGVARLAQHLLSGGRTALVGKTTSE